MYIVRCLQVPVAPRPSVTEAAAAAAPTASPMAAPTAAPPAVPPAATMSTARGGGAGWRWWAIGTTLWTFGSRRCVFDEIYNWLVVTGT